MTVRLMTEEMQALRANVTELHEKLILVCPTWVPSSITSDAEEDVMESLSKNVTDMRNILDRIIDSGRVFSISAPPSPAYAPPSPAYAPPSPVHAWLSPASPAPHSPSDDVELITSLPTWKAIERTMENVCGICLQMFGSDELKTLPCMHAYHTACVDNWLHRSMTCPTCKTAF